MNSGININISTFDDILKIKQFEFFWCGESNVNWISICAPVTTNYKHGMDETGISAVFTANSWISITTGRNLMYLLSC
jgi:hypothetical protein